MRTKKKTKMETWQGSKNKTTATHTTWHDVPFSRQGYGV